LKLNGKTDIPPDTAALSLVHATVADAVRLGADAGYTLYVGTPAAEADFAVQGRAIVTADLALEACGRARYATRGEFLHDVTGRLLPYWYDAIIPTCPGIAVCWCITRQR
jgi:hypothetical protein